MKTLALVSLLLFSGLTSPHSSAAAQRDPNFFANPDFQKTFPGATVLHPSTFEFLAGSFHYTALSGIRLIEAIRTQPGLAQAVLQFPKLSASMRIQVMKTVFALEVRASGMQAPELVLDDHAEKSTFFDFDPKHPSPGKVILNPAKLFADANPYAALLFLIHETRHSFQFQTAYAAGAPMAMAMANAYRTGFVAQRMIFDRGMKSSFCDFLTLNQEYEAFLFGNYVMKELTGGQVNTVDMGTLASQYIPGRGLRLDLAGLARKVGPQNLLGSFNNLEQAQYDELYPHH